MGTLRRKGNPISKKFLMVINTLLLVSEIRRKGNGTAAVFGDERCKNHWKAVSTV